MAKKTDTMKQQSNTGITLLDRNKAVPLYQQAENMLRSEILSGKWEINTVIPSENELCQLLGLSRMTIRSVITSLVRDGLLYRIQGKGTYVAAPKLSARSPAYIGIREQLESMGYLTATKLVHCVKVRAGKKIASALEISEDALVTYIERVRYVSNEAISIHRSYLPETLCPDFYSDELETEQLCTILLKDYKLEAQFVFEQLETTMASAPDAKLLNIRRNYPLILLEHINKNKNRRAFEFSQILFRGDRIKLHFEYER